jgi:hypothetical protein
VERLKVQTPALEKKKKGKIIAKEYKKREDLGLFRGSFLLLCYGPSSAQKFINDSV